MPIPFNLKKLKSICGLCVLFLFACTGKRVDYKEIKFEAGACYGTCPVFTLIDKARLDSLNTLLADADISGLKYKYAVDYTDAPTYDLTVTLANGQYKKIEDYGPCGPKKLQRLYDFLFSLRHSQKWK
jgi:hypothetical protein